MDEWFLQGSLSKCQLLPSAQTLTFLTTRIRNTYGPLRFHKMRQRAKATFNESGALNQFVSVSANSLNFGYGRQAFLDGSSQPTRSRYLSMC
ncbi:hypothetical protein F4823DRAFT_609495, partial [Ustulina deusta]